MPVTPIYPTTTAALPPSDPDFPTSAPQSGGAPHKDPLDEAPAEDAVTATEEKAIAYAADTGEFLDPPVYVCDGTKTYNQILADVNKGRSAGNTITLRDLMSWNGYFLSNEQLITLGTQTPQDGFRLSTVDPLMQPAEWPRDGILEYTANIYSENTIDRITATKQSSTRDVKTAQKDLSDYYTHLMCFGKGGSDYDKLESKANAAVKTLERVNPKQVDVWKQRALAAAEIRYGAFIAQQMDNGSISPAPDDALRAAANRMHDENLTPEQRRVAVAEYAYIIAHGRKPDGAVVTIAANTLNFIAAVGPGAVAAGGAIKTQMSNSNPAFQWTNNAFQRPQIVMTGANGAQIRLFDNGNGTTTMVTGREQLLPLTKRPTFIGQHMTVIPGGIGQYMTGTPATANPSPGSNPAGGRAPALPVQVALSFGQVVDVKQLNPGNFNVMPTWIVSPLSGQGQAITVQAWSAKDAADKTQAQATTPPGSSTPAQRSAPPVSASQRRLMQELIGDARAIGDLDLALKLEAQLAAGDLSALRGVLAMAEVQPGDHDANEAYITEAATWLERFADKYDQLAGDPNAAYVDFEQADIDKAMEYIDKLSDINMSNESLELKIEMMRLEAQDMEPFITGSTSLFRVEQTQIMLKAVQRFAVSVKFDNMFREARQEQAAANAGGIENSRFAADLGTLEFAPTQKTVAPKTLNDSGAVIHDINDVGPLHPDAVHYVQNDEQLYPDIPPEYEALNVTPLNQNQINSLKAMKLSVTNGAIASYIRGMTRGHEQSDSFDFINYGLDNTYNRPILNSQKFKEILKSDFKTFNIFGEEGGRGGVVIFATRLENGVEHTYEIHARPNDRGLLEVYSLSELIQE